MLQGYEAKDKQSVKCTYNVTLRCARLCAAWVLVMFIAFKSAGWHLLLMFTLSLSFSVSHIYKKKHTHTHKHRRCRMLLLLVRPDIIFIWRIYFLYLFSDSFLSNLSVIYKLPSKYFVFYDLQAIFLIYYTEIFITCIQTKFRFHTYKQ